MVIVINDALELATCIAIPGQETRGWWVEEATTGGPTKSQSPSTTPSWRRAEVQYYGTVGGEDKYVFKWTSNGY